MKLMQFLYSQNTHTAPSQTRKQQQQSQVTTAGSLTHIQESSDWEELQKTRAGRKETSHFPTPIPM